MKLRFLLCVLPILFAACEEQYKYSNIDYLSLSEPKRIIDLPDELEEISGLEAYGDNKIISIDDEKGIIYTINSTSGEIINTTDFGEKGDFEGLAADSLYMYTITSGGDLYKIDPKRPKDFEKYHWEIEGKEIESLTFYRGKLYSMTKEIENAEEMVLYALDPSLLAESSPQPVFKIKLQSIKEFLSKDEDESFLKEFTKFISGNNIYNFVRPSGIAFLEKNNHLLILSHHNRFLMEIGEKGDVVNIHSLSYEDFHQPEGITLDDDGFLYISNESRGHLPNILKFSYH